MTGALTVYSAVFMRYALAVTPKNYLLFGCHLVNFSAQATQGYRYLSWNNWGGKEKALEERAKQAGAVGAEAVKSVEGKVKDGVQAVKENVAK